MSSTYSTNNRYELMADGEDDTTWGQKTNATLNLIEARTDGITSLGVTGGGTITLTTANGATDQARTGVLVLTGSPGAPVTIVYPATSWQRIIVNNSSQSAVISVVGGNLTKTIPAGFAETLYSDGTNVNEVNTYAAVLKVGSLTAIGGGSLDGFTLDGGTY